MFGRNARLAVALIGSLLAPLAAYGQGAILQGGPSTAGHAPMYVGSGQQGGQTVVQDSGPASGGAAGLGLSEFLQVSRSATGTGLFGTHNCSYSAPVASGSFYYLCWDANAQGGGLLAYGNGGSAAQLPLNFIVNGTAYAFPFVTTGVVGPNSTTVGHLAYWNNTTGTLLADGPAVAGVAANTLNAVTANYTIQNTDCGKTVQAGTGSTGFFTVTLPSVSGFAATCTVTVKNGDTTRGKLLSGFPSDVAGGSGILWPSQTVVVSIVNAAWATLSNPGIWQAPGSVTLNVNHSSGSDSNNDCLGTVSGACATTLHAYLMFQTIVKPGGAGSATISNAANETFTESPPAAFLGPSLTGGASGGAVFFVGNGATWNTAGITFDDGAVASISGFTMKCTGSANTAINVAKQGLLVLGPSMVFDACPSGAHMQTFEGGTIIADSGYSVTGNANYHVVNNNHGLFSVAGKTITVASPLTFISWVSGNQGAVASFSGTTFIGGGAGSASTGSKYDIHGSGTNLVLNGATLPGATAGGFDTNACVDSICIPGTRSAFSGTPTCSSTVYGAIATIADSPTNTWGANITVGGGANTVAAYCNGANWTVLGK